MCRLHPHHLPKQCAPLGPQLHPAPLRPRRRSSHRQRNRLAAGAAPGAAARWRSRRQLPRKLPAQLRAAATGSPRRLGRPGLRRSGLHLLSGQQKVRKKVVLKKSALILNALSRQFSIYNDCLDFFNSSIQFLPYFLHVHACTFCSTPALYYTCVPEHDSVVC